ncbi:Glutathione S-transferase-like protein OpS6 [Pseudocercospora fuligena]|uniref:Glutathione S-transferase-like protein OpS6 n=1 Tax=Pseudocercospora fuligena TaxID=685502 RepID=A0A8H6VQI1_9PEZI|nr:Glutathione S-transferase-like protein OpS6 [Pseudocercospora fuligena]
MSTKPIILYGHKAGPNPWKVVLILEELDLPYEHKFMEMDELKKEPFESVNPNGRVPAMEDPNAGLVLWESGACIDYLCETYDKESRLSPKDPQAKWLARAWRDFQMSGQGPYFGQYSWFIKYHPEKVQSAIDRYWNEIVRVIGVIDRHIAKQKTTYLVGEAVTYADLMWVPWMVFGLRKVEDKINRESHPSFFAWWDAVCERPSVERTKELWAESSEKRKAELLAERAAKAAVGK